MKYYLHALALMLAVALPFTTHAFSLDTVIKQWIEYMQEKVATLEEENAMLKERLAACDGDASSPVEISLTAIDVSTSTVTVEWQTSIPSESWLILYLDGTEERYSSANRTFHSVDIVGLDNDTTYQFALVAKGDSEMESRARYSLTTVKESTRTPLQISIPQLAPESTRAAMP